MVPYILNYLMALGHVFPWTRADVFTALCEVEDLLNTQKIIIEDLQDYINKGEEMLLSLKKHLHIYTTEHQKAMEDIPNYLGSPINAFTLIKRLIIDLNHIEDSIINYTEHTKNIALRHVDVKYPTAVDLTGAAQALSRLQEVYNLSVRDLSDGELGRTVHSTPMSAGDCYELGRALYNEKDFKHALPWMEQALRKRKDSDDPRPLSEADILEYISFLYYLLDDTKSALKWAKKLVEVEPNNAMIRNKILDYQNIITEEERTELHNNRQESSVDVEHMLPQELSYSELESNRYKSLCTEEIDVPTEVTNCRLHCRYLYEHHPFLRLAPIKMELVYSQPDVVVFHEVLSHEEIKLIQELAKPILERAGLYDPKTGKRTSSSKLMSKSSWLGDGDSPVVARVTQRVADMTGLSMISAEDLYVINYGIGGHYEPHLDVLTKKLREEQTHGKRIASAMFYMSDVVEGATVFPNLGLRLYPKKGSAVYWMNLHPSGESNFATVHAACPVLFGSKWVAIKWIHQEGQELLKPCALKYQPEG